MASDHDDDADQRIEHTGGDDAAECQRDIRTCRTRGCTRCHKHGPDEGKGGAEIARHTTADGNEENERRDTRKQDRDIRIEPHDQRRKNRGTEHRHDMLKTEHRCLSRRQPLIGQDAPFGFQSPARKITTGIAHVVPPGNSRHALPGLSRFSS
ncbi:hypothetical protein D3C86_1245950 [compost metagenome]